MKTYADLLAFLLTLNKEQLAQTATVSCDQSEEAHAINYFSTVKKDDMLEGVLDDGHVILSINA